MNRGYVRIWRKIEDSGLIQLPNTLALFMHLTLKATHKDVKYGTSNGVIELKRGQFISGIHKLSEALGQTERQIRTSLQRLEKMDIITIESTNRFSIYTIENYSIYQDIDTQNDKQTTNKRQTNDKQTTTKQEHNNLITKELNTIDKNLLDEWLAIRKKKKCGEITERVFNALTRECNSIGWTLEQAIQKCCERSWATFEAGYLNKRELDEIIDKSGVPF